MSLIETLKFALARNLSEASETDLSAADFEYPELAENGDLSFPCFPLAKSLKLAPPKIAADLAARLKRPDGVARVEAKGPYLNFFLDQGMLVERATAEVLAAGDASGDHAAQKGEKVMVE